MTQPSATHQALAQLRDAGLDPQVDVPASTLGYWRIGGPVDLFVEAPTRTQLAAVMARKLPVTVIGNGSNLLVADAGIRGITIRLTGEFKESHVQNADSNPQIEVGGGLMNTVLLHRVNQADLEGLAALAGVPGTVGGAITMNAGTALGEIGDRVIAAEVVLPGGTTERLTHPDLAFEYRHATLPSGAVVSRVWLRLDPKADEHATIAHHIQRRKATQPLDQPSCGSVFRNPPGDFAGRLIEAAGLKGAQSGGAQISPKHANFIVNNGNATAADVYALVVLARQQVAAQSGVVLEPEVHAVGDWPQHHWPLPNPLSA